MFLVRVCYREDSWENRRMKGKQHLLFSSCGYLLICWHFVFMKQELDPEVALLFLYLFQILVLSEVGVFTFVMKDLDIYRALLSPGSETRIDRVSVGFQVEFVVSGLLLILLFKSIFPSSQTQRQQPSQQLIIQLPQLLTVNSLLKIPLSVFVSC